MVICLIVLGMVPLGIDEMIFFNSEDFWKGPVINYDSSSIGFQNHLQKAAVNPESPTFSFPKGKINLGRKTYKSWASAANHRFPKGFWESYENLIRKFNERHSEKSKFTTADLFKHRGDSKFSMVPNLSFKLIYKEQAPSLDMKAPNYEVLENQHFKPYSIISASWQLFRQFVHLWSMQFITVYHTILPNFLKISLLITR